MAKGQEKIAPITCTELRDVGFCVKGQREFARENGIDFKKFLAEGLSAERLETINAAALKRVLDRRSGNGNGQQ